MKGFCPLADTETPPVCIQVPDSRSVFTSQGVTELKKPDGRSRCFKIDSGVNFEIMLPDITQEAAQDAESTLQPEKPLLYVERSFTGHGAERGGVQTILTNPNPDKEVEFVYFESLPWFMRIYLHTMEARVAGNPWVRPDIIQGTYYRPALDRARGTQLEVKMRIPPASTVFLTYDFEKAILRYTEYPPDANRGFDIAAAAITILSPLPSTLRTTSLLLSLPTPDFSMPYNVIIFTSTAIALAFGGVFNIIVRRFVAADEGSKVSLKTVVRKVVVRIRNLLNKK